MSNKIIYIGIVAVALILVGGGAWWLIGQNKTAPKTTLGGQGTTKIELSPEIEKVLSKKLDLVKDLAKDPTIIAQVKAANEKDKSSTVDQYYDQDNKWRSAKDSSDPFIKPYLENDTAKVLKSFQAKNPGFSEIFVTDKYGLNVGQTNRTTDFYQADEGWWVKANDERQSGGVAYHGDIEFDKSAQAEAISIYVPVNDPGTTPIVGVIKAVLSIAAIKSEL